MVRSDLPLGFLVAQAVHAAGESSPTRVPVGTNAVVLGIPTERALLQLAARLEAAGVAHVVVREPDAPWNGQATAIGLEPVADRSALRPLLGSLSLLTHAGYCAGCGGESVNHTCSGRRSARSA